MTTKPHNDSATIAVDARRVLGAARAALKNADFKKRVTSHELTAFEANIEALEAGDGARSTALTSQVAAGVHVAKARAAILGVLVDVRDDAKLAFASDKAMQHAFGVGMNLSPGSTSGVRHEAESVLAAAHAHAAEGKQVGLDAHGAHHLEDLIHALDGTDLAHVQTMHGRHANATTTDSLAHAVSAEAAHVRLAARRVFRGDDAALAPFARTLPRHAVVPRHPPAPPPPPQPDGA